MSPSAPSASKWQNLLDQLNTSSYFFRPKEGSTRLRLIPLPGMDYEAEGFQFWAEAQTNFRGQVRTKFVIAALILEAKGARPEMATTVTPVIISKAVLKGILGLLAEGYDLFGPEGYGITLKRSGQGLETDYAVMPSKNPVKVNEEDIDVPDMTLEEMAAEFEKWANRPGGAGSRSDDDSADDGIVEEPRRKSSGRRSSGGDW